ncbi:MAG: hypothetical protein IIC53_11585 [Proteobacteria bacterium]|nr:hypothetical protein [Pseudomonadota bacterium]MCH8997644.1 hypothetical protein [Pseudomonadota bacterium]
MTVPMTFDPFVVGLVLLAALMHASWNAIVIYALTLSQMAHVAALRETSVIFAATAVAGPCGAGEIACVRSIWLP